MKISRLLTLTVVCVAAASINGCAKPPFSMPDASEIGFDGTSLVPPDCSKLERPSVLRDAGWSRPSMQWGCATYTNLAAQVVNPQDLVAPQPLGPADAAVAASAVRRYETGHVIPLDTGTSRTAK